MAEPVNKENALISALRKKMQPKPVEKTREGYNFYTRKKYLAGEDPLTYEEWVESKE